MPSGPSRIGIVPKRGGVRYSKGCRTCLEHRVKVGTVLHYIYISGLIFLRVILM